MFKEKLVIDIMEENYSKIKCLIGDTLELDIDILANGEPFNIDSFNILIEQGLENGNFNIQSTGITKNKNNLICSLSNKFTSIKGKHSIDISVIKNEYKKTTFKIPFEVYEGAIPVNSSEQEITISILEDLKAEILKAEDAKAALDSSINQANLKNLVTKDEFAPVKEKTEALNSIKENGGTFAGYSFSEWSISPQGTSGKSLGNASFPFKDVYVRGSVFESWGYCKLTNGLILCWGTDERHGLSSETVEFDAWFKSAFPNQCLKIVLSLENNIHDIGKFTGLCLLDQMGANQRPQEGFKWRAIVNSEYPYTIKVNWFAIGF